MINTGLGRFGLKAKQAMPFDHDTVIIFFLGGLCIADIRAMSEAVDQAASESMSFVCGGSTLIIPTDVLSLL